MDLDKKLEPILVMTTGGTIDKEYFDALSSYEVGESVALKIIAMANVARPVPVVEVFRKDSLDISDKDRAAIRSMVCAAPNERIVITHGTDTMAKTAEALNGIRGKTIVLVGAMAPARFQESDAAFNLGMAIGVVQIAEPGVYITMNGTVFAAGTVKKDREVGKFVTVARQAA